MVKQINSFVWYYYNSNEEVPADIRRDLDRLLAAAEYLGKHPGRIDVHARIVSIINCIAEKDKTEQTRAILEELNNDLVNHKYPSKYIKNFLNRATNRFEMIMDTIERYADEISIEYDGYLMEVYGIAESMKHDISYMPDKAIMKLARFYYNIQWEMLATFKNYIALAARRNDDASVKLLSEMYDNLARIIAKWK